MPSDPQGLRDWERPLAAERHLHGAVLVGGTAAAVHADHRVSMDGDHVLQDLRGRFDDVGEDVDLGATLPDYFSGTAI